MQEPSESFLKYRDKNGDYMPQSFLCHNWSEYNDTCNPNNASDALDSLDSE